MNVLRHHPSCDGLLYLGLALTGILSFLVIRSRLFVAGDAAATHANLVADENLARWGIALELGVVLFQALVALWFFRLFRTVNAAAAGAIAAFGLVNAVAILFATMFWSTALAVAIDPSAASSPGATPLRRLCCSSTSTTPHGMPATCSSACGSSRWASPCSRPGGFGLSVGR